MEVPRKLRGYVSEETLDAIARADEDAEKGTSGEIVVHLAATLLPFESARRRALRTFQELGVFRTRLRNGVLLFFVLKKRRFEIVADKGIDGRVEASEWRAMAARITDAIDRQGFDQGVCRAVALVGEALARHFPRSEEDVDELPNRPLPGKTGKL
jgi:uncharacterized membrane protein